MTPFFRFVLPRYLRVDRPFDGIFLQNPLQQANLYQVLTETVS